MHHPDIQQALLAFIEWLDSEEGHAVVFPDDLDELSPAGQLYRAAKRAFIYAHIKGRCDQDAAQRGPTNGN